MKLAIFIFSLLFSSLQSHAMEGTPDFMTPSTIVRDLSNKAQEAPMCVSEAEDVYNKNEHLLILPSPSELERIINETISPHFYDHAPWIQEQFKSHPDNSIKMTPVSLSMTLQWGFDNYRDYIKENGFSTEEVNAVTGYLSRLFHPLFLKIYRGSVPKNSKN